MFRKKPIDQEKVALKQLGLDENITPMPTDKNLSAFINCLLGYGIKTIKGSEFDLGVVFNNGTILNCWNSNRYHAWMFRGEIIHNGEVVYTWKDSQPSALVMVRFLERQREFVLSKFKDIKPKDNYDESNA